MMPYPKKGEKRSEYLKRAIPMIADEHPEKNRDQLVGMANGMYDYYRKNPKKKARRK